MRGPFAPEVDRLRREAPREVGGLERTLASLPVYRTYVEPWSGLVDDADREAIRAAGLPESLERVLLLQDRGWDAFVTRFQQTTPAIMAKGVEDTAFYRYARLLALNDVGGDPGRFGITVEHFHAGNRERARRFPANLLVTQTHDTKRSGDVRARIGALAGMPDEWAAHVRRWFEACSPLRGPDAVERYFIFQTLVGAWPIEPERLEAYIEKALREAKRNTSWIEPDTSYEERVKSFCRALYGHRPFLRDFEPFVAEVARAGERAALGQLLLKLTVPGVPDIYQGDELLALSLVDPDNRRPVDWARRRELLAAGTPRRGAGRRDAQAVADRARADAAGAPAGRLRAAPIRRSRPGRTRARSCAATRCSRPPRCAATAPGRLWTFPRERGATCWPAASARSPAACRSPSCSTTTASRCSSALNETGPPRWDGPFPACGC